MIHKYVLQVVFRGIFLKDFIVQEESKVKHSATNETELRSDDMETKEQKEEGEKEEKKEEKKEEEKKKELKCPLIDRHHISQLVQILTLENVRSDKIAGSVSGIIARLCSESQNRENIQQELLSLIQNLALVSVENLKLLRADLPNFLLDSHSASLQSPNLFYAYKNSSHHERKLLKVLRILLDLVPTPVNLSDERASFNRLLQDLVPLWDSLRACLSLYVASSPASNSQTLAEMRKETTSTLPNSSTSSSSTSSNSTLLSSRDQSTMEYINGRTPTLSPILGLLSPLIEVFFAIHSKCLASFPTKEEVQATNDKLESETEQLRECEKRVVAFMEDFRRPLNELVRLNPSLLQSEDDEEEAGTFSLMVKYPKILDFDNKRLYFRTELQRMDDVRQHLGGIRISIRRAQVFEDSYHQLRSRTKEEMKERISVHFVGEEGVDAGGLLREFYSLLAREMFNPNYALFTPTSISTFQPNRSSSINADHLSYFTFVGRMIAKSILDGVMMDAYFTRSLYKHILGIPVHYSDIEVTYIYHSNNVAFSHWKL